MRFKAIFILLLILTIVPLDDYLVRIVCNGGYACTMIGANVIYISNKDSVTSTRFRFFLAHEVYHWANQDTDERKANEFGCRFVGGKMSKVENKCLVD